MTDDPKNNESRSQEITKRTNIVPFVENIIGQDFTIVHIVSGSKRVRSGSIRRDFSVGDTVCLAIGTFEIENIPGDNGVYKEISIRYSAAELQRIITRLHLINDMPIDSSANRKGIKRCCGCRVGHAAASFFDEIEYGIDSGMTDKYIADRKRELIYKVITHGDEDMVNCILDNTNPDREAFIRIVYTHIFVFCSLEELAAKCHRSLSTFKSDFWNIFDDTPHHWFMVQRMNRACFLLLTADMSIEEIGYECIYSNPSHFIKVFRKHYGITPAVYRRRMRVRLMADGEKE